MGIQQQGSRDFGSVFTPAIPEGKGASSSCQNLEVVENSPGALRSLSHLLFFSFTSVIHESPNSMLRDILGGEKMLIFI